jgi:hypothetical protein
MAPCDSPEKASKLHILKNSPTQTLAGQWFRKVTPHIRQRQSRKDNQSKKSKSHGDVRMETPARKDFFRET